MSRGRVARPPDPAPAGVAAVVLTYMRPRLAGDVVRSLIASEGLAGDRIVVVVNGRGGLDDTRLEDQVRMVRLAANSGPAGGFRAGLEAAFADPAIRWAYLCEDDVGLFDLPSPRLGPVLRRVDGLGQAEAQVGAVVAYGRNFVGRGAHTENVVPPDGSAGSFTPVDVACWGATLLSRAVFEAGVLPDERWFFGLEDFDFFCRVREAGFRVVVDDESARAVAGQQTSAGRARAIGSARPDDAGEAWRRYYHARNSFELARRHGHSDWYAWHVLYSLRHLQKARNGEERSAILHGMWDGARGRMGEHPRYRRDVGEFASPADPAPSRAGDPSAK